MVNNKNKFVAIQNGCNNIITHDSDDKIVFDTEKEAITAVEDAVREEYCNYDSSEGDVVIYELVPVKIAKTPSSVIWSKVA